MYGYIILRDIPKERVQLDFALYDIQGGFRGFANVQPGIHYVTVKDGEDMVKGFWCNVKPNDAIIKRYDYTSKEFLDCEPEIEAQYKEMALSGAMNQTLISVVQKSPTWAKFWQELTSFINPETFPPQLHKEAPINPPSELSTEELEKWYLTNFKSRFEQAFVDTHKESIADFLEELQYSYVLHILYKDKVALSRWLHLLQAIYNAGERTIEKYPGLFVKILLVIKKQFNTVSEEALVPSSQIVSGIDKLLEDMEDTGIGLLDVKAHEFKKYARERGLILGK